MDTEGLVIQIVFAVLVIGGAVELFAIIFGVVSGFKERHCYSQRTKKYISGEYESILQNAYSSWDINLEKKMMSRKKLRQICVSCYQNLNQRPLYSAGTISREFGASKVSINILVAVKPFESSETYSETSIPTEFYTWIIFNVIPTDSEQFRMKGSFYADNCYPYPNAINTFNSFKQHMSDKRKRKYDMNALISGGVNIENNITISYNGVKRSQWQNAVDSGLCDEIEELYSILKLKFILDYEKGEFKLAIWIKMPDNEMYNGHNDFAVVNAEKLSSVAQKLCDIAYITDKA